MTVQPERDPGELLTYLHILADGSRPTQFFDLRYSPPAGMMRQRFVSVLRIHQIAGRITALSATAEVFVGAALRDSARGDKTAITGSNLLYIESDDPATRGRLARFDCSPSMVVASGSPGHLHIYWRLSEHASAAQIEATNRRLALGLHGEPGCADIVRVLRPPSSLNHKHSPPAPVRLLEHNPNARYPLADVLATLPVDPRPPHAERAWSPSHRVGRTALDRALLAIPAADYVRVLTGREPNHAGKVLCPFHQETDASLQLYPDGTFYCFGARCRSGGTIFDFAGLLWSIGTRKRDFLELRRRLARTFGLTAQSGQVSQ
ncbi:MAG TPA: DNA-primase RepB domain-containing protein [Solirubrobacteraceae bacterium]|nr:DNA-primase RepB domain-containing protein [Solirubrobacteraceae bacterium]